MLQTLYVILKYLPSKSALYFTRKAYFILDVPFSWEIFDLYLELFIFTDGKVDSYTQLFQKVFKWLNWPSVLKFKFSLIKFTKFSCSLILATFLILNNMINGYHIGPKSSLVYVFQKSIFKIKRGNNTED